MLSANFLNLPSPHMDLEQITTMLVLCSEVFMLCFHSLTLLSCQLQMIRGGRNVWLGWGARDTWNMIICKIIINKHKNICIGVYWNDVNVSSWMVLVSSNNIDFISEGEMAELVKKEVIFDCLVIFFHNNYTHHSMVPWYSPFFSRRQDPFHFFEEELTMTAQDIQMLCVTGLNILLMKENNSGVWLQPYSLSCPPACT
jgi:hypothetical protein